jgi:hypothetical protein
VKAVILIARPRSGTTALRGVLARHSKIASLGEVFHENDVNDPDYFFFYYLSEVKKNPEYALPSRSNRSALFKDYINYAGTRFKKKFPGKEWLFFGINYNSLHCLNAYWQNFFEEPLMLSIIKWQGYSVVHLIRRNLVEAAVSEIRAKVSGVWHIKASEERPADANKKLRIDAKNFLRQLHARALEIDLIEKSMVGYRRCLTLEYEKFFDSEGKPVPTEIDGLAKFLSLDSPIEATTEYQKTRTAHLRDAIENYDEVAATLRGTKFAGMLGSE